MNKTTHDFALELLKMPNIPIVMFLNEKDDDENLYFPTLNFFETENKENIIIISALKKVNK